MAIRSRLIYRPPVYEGVPRPEFQRYVWRFGHLYAEFISAGMLHLIGRAPNVKRMPALIRFYTREGLEAAITDSMEAGMNSRVFTDTLLRWPKYAEAIELPSYVNPDLRFQFQPYSVPDKAI
jgi:hypothetical protein